MTAPTALADAMTAVALTALDPAGLGGVLVHGASRAVADILEAELAEGIGPDAPRRRLPSSVDMARLDGGLDIGATLAAGRPILAPGLVAQVAGGFLVLPMAERLAPGIAARLAAALDAGDAHAPVAMLAFDDGTEDDPAPAGALSDRLAFHVAVDGLALRDLADAAGADLPSPADRPTPVLSDDDLAALATAADDLGIGSTRSLLQAAAAARASAVLNRRATVEADDLILAARLVLGPRATRIPVAAASPEPPPPPPPGDDADADTDAGDPSERPLADVVVEAATAALPAHLLAGLQPPRARPRASDGRAGPERATAAGGGRPLASRPGRPGSGARLDLIETLRAAAPLQRLRAAPPAGCLVAVRPSDLRIRRFRRHARTTTLFVVDASGSSALHRLGEAKGAVELMLSDCYVRRDRVAMIAFRGTGADAVLPPTGSLTAARRRLADMAAGGGTPLASGIDAASAMAARIRREDESVVVVFLTDGQANVARDGAGGRARADADAIDAAARLKGAGLPVLLLDIADRPHPRARTLADALGATYLPLPRADAGRVAAAVRAEAARGRH